MTKIWGGCNPCLNSYHQTDSLLFQFILSEFLQVLSSALIIEKARLYSNDLHELKAGLRLLASCPCPGVIRSFPWSLEDGRLTKLKAYIDYLVEGWQDEPAIPIAQTLQKNIHQAWFAALEASHSVGNEDRDELNLKLDKLLASCQKLKKGMAKLLPFFAHDENVVFFLIRHHTEFSGNYGSDFVFKTLQKMYSNGIEEAQDFLETSFKERNFYEVLPAIASFFNSNAEAAV